MLIYVTMKCPNGVYEAENEAKEDGLESEMDAILYKYFRYNEYALLEFNTETGTSRVVPLREQ